MQRKRDRYTEPSYVPLVLISFEKPFFFSSLSWVFFLYFSTLVRMIASHLFEIVWAVNIEDFSFVRIFLFLSQQLTISVLWDFYVRLQKQCKKIESQENAQLKLQDNRKKFAQFKLMETVKSNRKMLAIIGPRKLWKCKKLTEARNNTKQNCTILKKIPLRTSKK